MCVDWCLCVEPKHILWNEYVYVFDVCVLLMYLMLMYLMLMYFIWVMCEFVFVCVVCVCVCLVNYTHIWWVYVHIDDVCWYGLMCFYLWVDVFVSWCVCVWGWVLCDVCVDECDFYINLEISVCVCVDDNNLSELFDVCWWKWDVLNTHTDNTHINIYSSSHQQTQL